MATTGNSSSAFRSTGAAAVRTIGPALSAVRDGPSGGGSARANSPQPKRDIVSANPGSDRKRPKKSGSGKILRDMLEHAVICTAPMRTMCPECKELREALADHASRCIRSSCSMPFCGNRKAEWTSLTNDAVSEEQPAKASVRVISNGASAKMGSVTSKETASRQISLPAVRGQLPFSNSANTMPVISSEPSLQRITRMDSTPDADEVVGESKDELLMTATSTTPNIGSAVTMRGTFDGRMTYHGKWFYDNHSSVESDFGYVFKEEDVSDPDGSLPCHICNLPEPESNSENSFIVCDLCDNVFHLACAKLQSIPQNAWYCSECTGIRSRLIPSYLGDSVRLPPSRNWAGFFLLDEKRVRETFRLEFDWRQEPDADGIIALVKGKGQNSFGPFTISGKLATPKAPSTSFPLTLAKTYDD